MRIFSPLNLALLISVFVQCNITSQWPECLQIYSLSSEHKFRIARYYLTWLMLQNLWLTNRWNLLLTISPLHKICSVLNALWEDIISFNEFVTTTSKNKALSWAIVQMSSATPHIHFRPWTKKQTTPTEVTSRQTENTCPYLKVKLYES